MDYKTAGVDVEAGYRSVELMKADVVSTHRSGVIGGIGGFAGAFALNPVIAAMENPVLLSATDGVGTKLKLAFITDRHDTVGIDLVAMCVNDLACAGGEPLFFLDYIACGRNVPEKTAAIVRGVAAGCKEAGAALIGGETAEHPGMMPEDEYDLAGFAVGVVDQKDMIDGAAISAGDVLVGIASSGVHSNGFSLLRRILPIDRVGLDTYHDCLGETLGACLMRPTKIYVQALRAINDSGVTIKGACHITGGGWIENIPRMLPDGIAAVIDKGCYPVPPIFGLVKASGGLSDEVMYGTFNMGIGMVICVDEKDAAASVAALGKVGEKAYIIGKTINGEEKLCLR